MRVIIRVLVAATLAFGWGCAQTDWIDRTLVTETVTGVWAGSMVSPDGQPTISQEVRLELQQHGSKVLGSFEGLGSIGTGFRGSAPLDGSVAGDVFRFKGPRGIVSESLAAGMTIPEIVRAYPTLTEEAVKGALEELARSKQLTTS